MTAHDPEIGSPVHPVDFRARAIRGGAVMFAAQVGKFLLNTAATILLARLLTPDDYGVFAVAFGIVGSISLFGDFGLSLATVQSPTITHRQMSTLFWLNLGLGAILAALGLAIAPLVGWIFGDRRLTVVLAAMAWVHAFIGLKSQHLALLTRQMRFTTLVTIEVVSLAAGIVLAVASAWHGAGYWALVVLYVPRRPRRPPAPGFPVPGDRAGPFGARASGPGWPSAATSRDSTSSVTSRIFFPTC